MVTESSVNLFNASRAQIEAQFAEWKQPRFRATQFIRWLWKEGVTELDKMSNLSKDLKKIIQDQHRIQAPTIATAQNSSDGTIKYLLRLEDGRTVETVWIPREDQGRVTVCISTQVGCKMGCTFCLTAQQKVERNLTAGEIAGQILVLPNREKITNIVVMGMGEPFDNYDNLMGGLDLLTHADALNLGPRKITVSTSGLVPAIIRFVKESKCQLAVSLNAPNDEIRTQIMPINRAYNLDKLLGTLREISRHDYEKARKHKFGITFEYILIKDLNDQPEHARELVRRLHGIPCKINLLLYNENPNVPFKRPDPQSVTRFQEILSQHDLLNFIRHSRGRDISAACGQLASLHKRQAAASVAQYA